MYFRVDVVVKGAGFGVRSQLYGQNCIPLVSLMPGEGFKGVGGGGEGKEGGRGRRGRGRRGGGGGEGKEGGEGGRRW